VSVASPRGLEAVSTLTLREGECSAKHAAGPHPHSLSTRFARFVFAQRVGKVPGTLSVVGLFAPPMLWIAAPMQAANLRRTHDEVAPSLRTSSGKVLGLSLRAEF
jgi:hypothetical protein